MSLVNTLMSGSGLVPTYESFMSCDDMYTGTIRDDYCDDYLIDRLYESTVGELMAAQEANLIVDIMSEVKVMTEGADPQVLMEGVLANIGEAIKKFFAKIAQFFKDLWANITNKAKKAKDTEENQKLAAEMDSLRAEMRGMKASQTLESTTFEMYNYPKNAMETGSTLCSNVINKYETAVGVYKDTLDTIISKVEIVNKDYESNYDKNKYDKGRNYDDIDWRGAGSKTRDYKSRGVDALVRQAEMKGSSADRWYRAGDASIAKQIKDGDQNRYKLDGSGNVKTGKDGKPIANPEYGKGGDSGESRAKSGYGGMSDADKLDYDNDIKKLRLTYEESKLPVGIGAGNITKEEAELGRNEYIKYVMRGKKTTKTNLSYEDAKKCLFDLSGASDFGDSNGTFYAFCIGDEKSNLYKAQFKIVQDAQNGVDKIKREIDAILKKAEKAIQSDGKGYDKIRSAVDTISGFVTNHVSAVSDLAKIPAQMLGEMQACGRALLRAYLADCKRRNSADYDKTREKWTDYEKEREEKATRESAGLFEQAYSLGLF